MPLIHKSCLLALSLLLLPAIANAELPGLTVQVLGVTPASGTLEISLFNSAETFMKEPYLQESHVVSEEGMAEISFAGLLEGDYAVVVVHDSNDNGTLDRGFLGFGGESYGFSNNPFQLIGWPDFEDASFAIYDSNTTVEIELN